jgi:hypothetical protein
LRCRAAQAQAELAPTQPNPEGALKKHKSKSLLLPGFEEPSAKRSHSVNDVVVVGDDGLDFRHVHTFFADMAEVLAL